MAGPTERPSTTDEPVGAVSELTFDEALAELQRTIAELETGGQPLERTLALHERGAALLAHCETLLRSAELRMRQLVSKSGELRTVDVTADHPIEEP
jgi:exodeoxyribonuclease VII small subunit